MTQAISHISAEQFRGYLQRELLSRIKDRPGYSLRKFAKALDTDPSALAKILSGKMNLGPRTIERLGQQLSLSSEEIEYFKTTQRASKSGGSQTEANQVSYRVLKTEAINVIDEWYLYALLELTRTSSFKPKLSWVAKTLGIQPIEAQIAVDRLKSIGLLEVTKTGQWIDRSGDMVTNISSPFYSTSQKRLQRQILEKAIHALEEIPVAYRDQTSMTFAIHTDLLPLAKEKIKKFRREMDLLLCKTKTKDHVYHLSVSLYPVTNVRSNQGENSEK